MYLSELISKRVISIKTATDEGMIVGAYVDMLSLTPKYLCLDSGKVMAQSDIFSVSEVITVVDELDTPEDTTPYYKITTTQEVITASGARLGRVVDILLWGKGKKGELLCDKDSIKLKSIVAVSQNIITANPTYKTLEKVVKPLHKEILSLEPSKGEITNTLQEQNAPYPHYDFLIGKKVKSEVSDISRSFVLMAGTLITERVIENARRAGKLSDLVNKSR